MPPEPSPWHDLALLKNLILPIALFAIYAGFVRLIERRRAREVDFRKGASTLLLGVIVGSTIIGLTVLVLWNLGMVEISSRTGFAGIGRELSVLMITTMIEELLFRVILFAIVEEILGSLGAILISALAFGLAHVANPNATPFAIFALSVELGVMLALAYMLTRNVWVAVGIHAGWNFTQSFVFGALNSGQQHPHSYFQTSLAGPDYLTGGLFGLEGSVVSLGLSVVVSAVLFALILQKRRWISLRFRLGSPREEFMDA
ncbi:MAG TPA: CPBP family intramembrane glutamic endopeptidase [Verrucomicrobiae bacterium]|nr:CPBP family intramembrane glutamic endopeptidase [Verrucomicrobiae bacterium]